MSNLGEILDGTETMLGELIDIVDEIGRNLVAQLEELDAGGAVNVVTPEIRARLTADPALVGGGGVSFSEELAGVGRRVMEWWQVPREGGEARRLQASFDADSVDFYDYVDSEWYRSAIKAGGPVVVGPYVDALGTDENVITLAAPLVHEGKTLGVASLDVRAAELALRLRDKLRGLATRTALVNSERRVIASTSPEHLPGSLLGEEPAALHTGTLTNWQTVAF
jgi:hypothetical protein